MAPSSSGLGHRPFTAVTRVRFPSGSLGNPNRLPFEFTTQLSLGFFISCRNSFSADRRDLCFSTLKPSVAKGIEVVVAWIAGTSFLVESATGFHDWPIAKRKVRPAFIAILVR
jgi:hypothetical protein